MSASLTFFQTRYTPVSVGVSFNPVDTSVA
jgi:hypothetical protein